MPSVAVQSPDRPLNADAVVVGVRATKDGPVPTAGAEPVDDALGGRLTEALRALDATGEPDEVLRLPTLGRADFPLVVATGLGDAGADERPGAAAETVRRAAGAALRELTGRRRVHLAMVGDPGALAEGALLGAYQFTGYKSQAARSALRKITVTGTAGDRAAVRRAAVVAGAVATCRDLVNTPPNDLYPETFAARAAALAGEQSLTVEILDDRALKRGGYGGIRGVGQGSARAPRLVRISYRPARARTHVALVGKGITFDSGGLNLKTGPGMATMKSDMGGAAAVITATCAVAALKLPVAVTATVPMAENMPSGSSYRPSDILTLLDGTTVEVGDTDAEGRLVLADAITRAARDEPDRLLEVSTLTGAQVVSLGPRLIGAMGEPGWRDTVVAAGTAAGEPAWAMPLPHELRTGLDSPVADLVNVPGDRFGGMLVGGHFLAEFVPDGLPWVHLDIAGPSFNTTTAWGYTPKGATGAAVRTIVAAVDGLAR